MTSHDLQKFSSAEAYLFALIERDCEVLRARAESDEVDPPPPVRHRVSPSAETRARISAKMLGKTNAKKSSTVVPPTQHRRTGT